MKKTLYQQSSQKIGRIASFVKQRGQSSLEYGVVCAALAFALFVPILDAASPDTERTTVNIILEAFRTAYEKFSYAISLPT
ncbi:hypothetical protein EGT07_00445 [Herbaspirillum sp. HC18]|nr:hypothetical protein EGT07_00445 [Herbaspirillum sp. HC18]